MIKSFFIRVSGIMGLNTSLLTGIVLHAQLLAKPFLCCPHSANGACVSLVQSEGVEILGDAEGVKVSDNISHYIFI